MSVSESDSSSRGLRPVDPARENAGLGVPFAAMAEALRANAEAIQRIDSSQRKIADSIEKGDKSGQVITSTRALNDTFRGLSEIQRGLLDAVVKDRGRGRGIPFAFAAIAVLAGLLGFLVYDRISSTDTVPRTVYEQLRQTSDERADRLSEMSASVRDSGGQAAALERRLQDRDAKVADLQETNAGLERRIRVLGQDLGEQQARLKNFLAVKDIADRVGAVEVRNAQLEGENRVLKRRAEHAEKERARLLQLMGDKKIDERGTDPKLIEAALKKKGILPETPKTTPATLLPSMRRRLRQQLNLLLQQAPGEETYDILSFGGLKDGTTLTDVKLGHYRNAGLLNSLHCKELRVFVDPKKDTAELRCYQGFLSVTRHPAKKIPLDEAGHSIFLKEIGLKSWILRATIPVEVAKDGRLTWKTAP